MRVRSGVMVAVAGVAFGAGYALAQGGAQTGREPQFENDAVKVWRTRVLPDAPLPLHRHEHARVLIALKGGTMKILEESGQSELHAWQTGRAYWLPANPPGTRHQDVNVGPEPIEVMVVELKNAQ